MTEIEFNNDITVELVDSMGGDRAVLAAMMVSTQAQDSQDQLDEVLTDLDVAASGRINFLMKNKHGTPFEHGTMTFMVSAPIFVFREWHRHRIGVSINEESGRYKQLKPMYYVPGPDRKLMQVGKPGHYEYVEGTEELYEWLVEDMKEEARLNYARYEVRLNSGVAKEVARMGLGLNIYSSMYWTCNPRSLMSFLSLRTNRPDATFPSKPQREIEMGAEKMEAEFAKLFPLTYEAYQNNGRVSP